MYAFTGRYPHIARRCLSVLSLPSSRPAPEIIERISIVSESALLVSGPSFLF
jgi:hypothetical protein